MGFKLSELIVESVLREGMQEILDSLGTSTDKISDIFSQLTESYLSRKYGQRELDKIRDQLRKGIHIVHGYPLDDNEVPSITLNPMPSNEAERYAILDDFDEDMDVEATPVTLVGPFNADSYDSVTGRIYLTTANPDLSSVTTGQLLIEADGTQHRIVGGITNEDGNKSLMIESGLDSFSTINMRVASSITINRETMKSIRDVETVAVHTLADSALMAKYIHTVVKYIIVSNKQKLDIRGGCLVTTTSDEFARFPWMPDHLFSRNINVRFSALTHSWSDGAADLFDGTGIQTGDGEYGSTDYAIRVERDLYPRECEDELTVKTTEPE